MASSARSSSDAAALALTVRLALIGGAILAALPLPEFNSATSSRKSSADARADDRAGRGDRHRGGQHVGELAQIAGPLMLHHQRPHIRRQSPLRAALSQQQTGDDFAQIAALTQRRQPHGQAVQPVVQIVAGSRRP